MSAAPAPRRATVSGLSPSTPLPPTFFVTAPMAAVSAITVHGRAIPLFRYETVVLANADQRSCLQLPDAKRALVLAHEKKYLDNLKIDIHRLTRQSEPSPDCNCHGWVFTGGRFGIEDPLIAAILEDNGYVAVTRPDEGDVAVYWRGGGIAHSGRVRGLENGVVLVESKLGPFGVFLHPADHHPYDECRFFRSRRGGHLLRMKQA